MPSLMPSSRISVKRKSESQASCKDQTTPLSWLIRRKVCKQFFSNNNKCIASWWDLLFCVICYYNFQSTGTRTILRSYLGVPTIGAPNHDFFRDSCHWLIGGCLGRFFFFPIAGLGEDGNGKVGNEKIGNEKVSIEKVGDENVAFGITRGLGNFNQSPDREI